MRRGINFKSGQDTCAGWFYVPDATKDGTKLPFIVMAHGFSGVKEQGLGQVAEIFAAAGYAVLVFDYRYFGDSTGEPRQQLFPLDMVDDCRNAITWACAQPDVNTDRIGLWGTSFSGALAVRTATVDPRVRAVAIQVPIVIGPRARRDIDPARWDMVGRMLVADRTARFETGEIKTFPVVDKGDAPCVLPGEAAYEFFVGSQDKAPNWQNAVTLESLEKFREFDPVSNIDMMSDVAFLYIGGEKEHIFPLGALQEAFDRAHEPKKQVMLPVGHFEIYQEPWMTKATGEAVAWFDEHRKG
jgi:hypothetical protein